MNVLVTGGAGFIGSHVTRALLARTHHVTVLDDLSSGFEANLPSGAPGLAFVRGSVLDHDLVRELVAEADGVVHLAAVASVERSVEAPVATTTTNVLGTVALLAALPAEHRPRVLFASSAAVYGPAEGRCRESDPPRPQSPYAADKAAGELYLREVAERAGVRATALRFFNVYGERQDPRSPYSGVISIFAARCLARAGVDVFGDGGQTRDFVYAGDVATVIAHALVDERTDVPAVMNVATGRSVTLLELLDTLADLTGHAPARTYHPARPGDLYHSAADVSTLRAYLPELEITALRDGLERTVGSLR